jgi:hypothetical protein
MLDSNVLSLPNRPVDRANTCQHFTFLQVFLYSDDFEALSEASPPSVNGPSGHGKALAVATTKEDGRFSFLGLPCGSYKLVPLYKGEHTVFDVSPSELSVTVGHGGASVEKPFTVSIRSPLFLGLRSFLL